MAVPETSVHENDRPVFREDDIRFSRQDPSGAGGTGSLCACRAERTAQFRLRVSLPLMPAIIRLRTSGVTRSADHGSGGVRAGSGKREFRLEHIWGYATHAYASISPIWGRMSRRDRPHYRNNNGIAELPVCLRVGYGDPEPALILVLSNPINREHSRGVRRRGRRTLLADKDFRAVLVVACGEGAGRRHRGPNRE